MKEMKLKRQVMFTYRTFWDEEITPKLSELLKSIPIEPAIQFVAQLLHRLLTRTKFQRDFHQQEFNNWISLADSDTASAVLAEIAVNSTFSGTGFVVTDRICYIQLIQELLSVTSSPGKTLTEVQHGKLFQCLMVINERYVKTQQKLFKWDGTGDEDNYLKVVLPTHIPELGISRAKSLWIQTIKSYYFFEFCKSDSEYSVYLQKFLNHFSFPDYQVYISSVTLPYFKLMNELPPASTIRIDPNAVQVIRIFRSLSINGKTIVKDDFKTLRQFPLFQTAGNTFTVLFDNFFLDKLYHGMLFDFKEIVHHAGVTKMDYAKLKVDLGNRFSEHVMFYRTIERCFRKMGQVRKSGEVLKATLKKGEPDFYIRDGRKVFIFEFKDIMMAAQVKVSDSIDVIEAEISEKLEVSVKHPLKPQSKAVQQLFNSIQRLLSGEYKTTKTDDVNEAIVMTYPIIVHNDVAFEAEGVNYILRNKLRKMLENEGLPVHRIKDLLVMNIDTLIAFQDHFKDNKIKLGQCINDYNLYVNAHGPLNRMMAFDEFIKYYLAGKNIDNVKSPQLFVTILNEVVNHHI